MKLSTKIVLAYQRTRLQITALISPQKAAEKSLTLFCTPRRTDLQPHSDILESGELISFHMNNLVIRGYRWNHPSPKKILIAHGFQSAVGNFEGFVHPLINKGYEVVAFDAPAHGRSDGTEITLPLYVQTLQRIVTDYGPFNAYLAHSFGGLAIAHLLETVPHDEQTRIVLIAPATETTTAINGFFQLLHLNRSVRSVFDRLVKEKSGIPPEHLSVRRAVRNIKASILWLHDDQDDITPYSDAEKVKNEQHSNIQFIISSGLGHRKIYRDKHTLNHILLFL